MAADEKNVGSEGAVEDPVLKALNGLRTEQQKLRGSIEAVMKEGGPITKLANEMLELRKEIGQTGPIINARMDTLERKVHPVSRVEKAVLVVGAVAITNLALRLLSGATAPPQRGAAAPSLLEQLSYLVAP